MSSAPTPPPSATSTHSPLRRLSEWCYRTLGRWPWALVALVGFVTFIATVSTAQAEKTEEWSNGADLPDSSFWYTPADVYASAEAIGQHGRDAYVEARYTFDVVWPVVYTLFFVIVLSWVFRKVTEPGSRARLVNLFPLVPLAFDYLENVAAATVMARYPDETAVVAHLMPVFTALKWVTLSACFVLIVVGAALHLRRRVVRAA